MNSDIINRGICFLIWGSLAIFLSACGANIQAGSGATQGREALIRGDYQGAVSSFQSSAQADPNNTYIFGPQLKQGILSYLGRAQYLNGQLEAAQDTLRKDLTQQESNKTFALTQLYLGLTMARLGDRQAGMRDIESGTKGILDFLNYVQQTYRFDIGKLWDTGDLIRKAANANLATIAKGNFEWPMLISSSEALAMRFEQGWQNR
jgi:tetratricopeptide (TPR) repeat protein